MSRHANLPSLQQLTVWQLTGLVWLAVSMATSGCSHERSVQSGTFAPEEWVDLARFDPTLRLDLRYATSNNFTGVVLYESARAFMHKRPARALVTARERLQRLGFGLVIWDAYRPWSVTKMFWDRFPKFRPYLVDPAKGSRHNRGCAVDVTLYRLSSGKLADMPSGYDDFSERAHPNFKGGTGEQRHNRDQLRRAMEQVGFAVDPLEWWHYNFIGCDNYPIVDLTLSTMGSVVGSGEK